MTLVGVAMFKGYTMDQMMGGNLREKNRSFDAAQAALHSAEYWLSQPGNATNGITCAGLGMSNAPRVCNDPLPNPTTLASWANSVNYTPGAMLSVNSSGGSGTYAANPTYYIQFLGVDGSGASFYLITAAAQGGNANAVSVVQSAFKLSTNSGSL
jgi:type IV pilus assembly protein PilX